MQAIKILLIEDNPGDARLVREMLSDAENITFDIQSVECLMDGLDRLARFTYDVALVDLGLPDSSGVETFTALRSHAPGTPLVLLTGYDDDNLAMTTMRLGAEDYLVKGKFTTESLVRALRYAMVRHPRQQSEDSPLAKVVGILGAKGGVGTTTFASQLAISLKHLLPDKKVLAMDLDCTSSGMGFLLKIHSDFSLFDAATSLNRLDIHMWKAMVQQTKTGIDVIQPPGAIRFGEELNANRIRHVLRFTRRHYDWILMDVGRLHATAMNVLEDLQELFLVTTTDLPALFEAKRIVQKIADLQYDRSNTHLVVNRMTKSSGITQEELATLLGGPVQAMLPDVTLQLQQAYSAGASVLENSAFGKQVSELAGRMLGIAPKAPERHSFFRSVRVG